MLSLLRFLPAVALACALLPGAASASQLIYDQPFTNDQGGERSISVVSGWTTTLAADGTATTAVRVQTSRGGTLYMPALAAGYIIRGTDIDIALSSASTISINAGQSSALARFQFLIQIDDANWYSSNTIFTPATVTSTAWGSTASTDPIYSSSLSFDLAASSWSSFASTASGVTTTALTSDLSGSNITGIGIWVRGNTISRYDDLQVFSSIPEPGAFAAFAGAFGLVAAIAVRRRRA